MEQWGGQIRVNNGGTMEEREDLCKAMLKAQEAFNKYLEKQDYDPAYFSLYLTGYLNDTEFKKMEEVRMSLNRTGWEKFQYPDIDDEEE